MFRIHTQEPRFICDECEDTFTNREEYNLHDCEHKKMYRRRRILSGSKDQELQCFYVYCHTRCKTIEERDTHLMTDHFEVRQKLSIVRCNRHIYLNFTLLNQAAIQTTK